MLISFYCKVVSYACYAHAYVRTECYAMTPVSVVDSYIFNFEHIRYCRSGHSNIFNRMANSVDLDETARYNLDLHCLQRYIFRCAEIKALFTFLSLCFFFFFFLFLFFVFCFCFRLFNANVLPKDRLFLYLFFFSIAKLSAV